MGKITILNQEISVKAVAFDKDGTLFQAIPFWQEIDRLRRRKFLQITGEKYQARWEEAFGFIHPNEVDFKGLIAVAPEEDEIIVTASLLYQITKYPWHRCKEIAVQIFEESNRELRIQEAFQAIDGAESFITSLYNEGFFTGILTSDNKKRTKACVELLNTPPLHFLCTPEDVENGKPHPDMIIKTCKQLGIQTNELIMIGDTVVDVKMAKTAGSIAVGIATHEHAVEELMPYADFIIRSYADIQVASKKRQ